MLHVTLARRALPLLAIGLGAAAQAQTSLYTIDGPAANERLGMSAASAGDVNADGKPDFLAGGPEDGNVFNLGEGIARVYSGANGAVLHTLHGAVSADAFGSSGRGAGDANADGKADVVVGAPGHASQTGRAYLYSGASGTALFTLTGAATGDQFGFSVAGAGDVNADGRPDVIVGAPQHDAGGSDRGMARVYSGLNGALLWTVTGTTNGERVGQSVAIVGDLNGDGFAEFAAGSLNGGLKVYSGQNAGLLYAIPTPVNDRLGYSVAGAGLVNADAVPDFVVGAPQDGNVFSPGPGYAKVYSGANGSVLHTFTGDANGDRFGQSVGGARDLDGDGRVELIVGADQFSSGGNGYARVFNGQSGAIVYTFTGSSPNDRYGFAVDGLGDVDADGNLELIVGSPNRSGAQAINGRVQVWSEGGISCPTPTNYCVTTVNSSGLPAVISFSGSTSIAANDFVLHVAGCPPDKFGLFIYGVNQASVPFGNGTRCVGSPFFRLPPTPTGPAGTATFAVDYAALPAGGPITLGTVHNFTYLFRDPPAGGGNANASDGLNAFFCP